MKSPNFMLLFTHLLKKTVSPYVILMVNNNNYHYTKSLII